MIQWKSKFRDLHDWRYRGETKEMHYGKKKKQEDTQGENNNHENKDSKVSF